MPNHKSAEKRMRQNEKARVRNKAVRSELRTHFRKFDEAIASKDVAAAEAAFVSAESKLSRAATKNVIPRSRAARKTGRLAVQLQKLRAAE